MTPRTAFGINATEADRFLTQLRKRDVNYHAEEVTTAAWNVDIRRCALPAEQPGPPEPAGTWRAACRLVRGYEFSPPELVRAAYAPTEALLGRTLLLEARFAVLRLYLGVRITAVIDEQRSPQQRVWGFRYETLGGHLERGRLDYEVVKHEDDGRVEFVMTARSQRSPHLGLLLRLGWVLFGRRRQLRFYRRCGQRVQDLLCRSTANTSDSGAAAASDLVVVPPDSRVRWFDRFAVHVIAPG